LFTGYENNLHIALEKHALHVIPFDGIRRSRVGQFESLLMAPGQRADVLVQAGAIGSYALRTIANDQGYASLVGPLAHIIVDGELVPMALPAALGGGPFATIRDEEVTKTRRLTLSVDQPEFPPAANYQEFRFLVCGHMADANRVDQRIPLGAVRNGPSSTNMAKIFHTPIPSSRSQSMARNSPSGTGTIRCVPRNGSVTFRSRFLDFTGRFVHRCPDES
jgi:hypothetical protein